MRVNKGEKSDLLSGTVVSTGPLVVKVESFAGEQQVTVTPDPDVKYYKVSDLARADLQPGNQVAVYTDASGADAATATAVVQVPAAKHGKKPGKGKKGQATAAPVQ